MKKTTRVGDVRLRIVLFLASLATVTRPALLAQALQVPSVVDLGDMKACSMFNVISGTQVGPEYRDGRFDIRNVSGGDIDIVRFTSVDTAGPNIIRFPSERWPDLNRPIWHLRAGKTFTQYFFYEAIDTGESISRKRIVYRAADGSLDSLEFLAKAHAVSAQLPFLATLHVGDIEYTPCKFRGQTGKPTASGLMLINPTNDLLTVDSVSMTGDTLDFVSDQYLRSPWYAGFSRALPYDMDANSYLNFSSIWFRPLQNGSRNATFKAFCTGTTGNIVVSTSLAGAGVPPNGLMYLAPDNGWEVLVGEAVMDSCKESSHNNVISFLVPPGDCGDSANLRFRFIGPRANALTVVGGDVTVSSDSTYAFAVRYCPTSVDTPYSDPANPSGDWSLDTLLTTVSFPGGVVETQQTEVATRLRRKDNAVDDVVPRMSALRTFPVPFAGTLHIRNDGGTERAMRVCDQIGRTVEGTFVRTSQSEWMWSPAGSLPSGVYVLMLANPDGRTRVLPVPHIR